jgi:GTP diphosphokinase / guanosine-3',5'-bis(diphosphate) 3'-diphosphatase
MQEIIRTFDELEQLIKTSYDNPDLETLGRAFEMANTAHAGEKRLTGHDFITHPTSVAFRLAEMGLHMNVVVAGLLHDVVEDTGITTEDVAREFGDDVASLVDSVTKLKHGIKYRGAERYAENMRKMFLAMASDVRVVFMKFADRLHNLQTLYGQPKAKQERIARESLEIYAPIASRLGMSEFKGELEDGSFAYLLPQEYERMKNIMDIKVREKGAYVSRIIDQTEKMLAQTNITDIQVHGRVKRLYSLFKKLKRYQGDLGKIYDLIAIRIIVNDVAECYAALGLLHRTWRPVPGRIKDYIAQPKPNGYQSLHTTVFTENGEIVEFQIRTLEMHELAEYGVAAHWRYKEGGKHLKNTRWMEELAQIQKELASRKDFMEQLEIMKIDIFKDRIFVFTPQGDVIDLPEGATPVDFAYAIHTEVGNKCTAARINDMMRNLDTPLKSGDIVEITTDKNRKGPNPDWLKFVKTRHARNKIKDATKHTVKGWFAEVLKGRDKAKK